MAQQNAIKHIIGKIRNIKTTEIFVGLLVVAVILSLYTSSFETLYTERGRDEEKKGIQWVNHETNRSAGGKTAGKAVINKGSRKG